MRKGFTLIELLVVIAIIAILAAILFPVFLKARQMAMTAKCGSHGREIGIAMMMYLDDYNGRFPSRPGKEEMDTLTKFTWQYRWPGDPRAGKDIWSAGWIGSGSSTQPDSESPGVFRYLLLRKYVKSLDIWICPSPNGLYALKCASGYRSSWTFLTRQFMYSDADTYPDSAFRQEKRMGDPKESDDVVGRFITEVQSLDQNHWHRNKPPSKKIFAFCYALGPDVAGHTETFEGSGIMEPPLFPHNEGTIYVYVDGHAKHSVTGCGWAPVGYTDAHIDRPHEGEH
jgi:prepilin-type N-terminal cleavage/methylation domain-containing protein/prepilin-type processing-associated H-X9-DG protein